MSRNRGITLIALIVTVVIMLILMAVSVASLNNFKIFDLAKKGAKKYSEEQYLEQIKLNLGPDLYLEDDIYKAIAKTKENNNYEVLNNGLVSIDDNGNECFYVKDKFQNTYKVTRIDNKSYSIDLVNGNEVQNATNKNSFVISNKSIGEVAEDKAKEIILDKDTELIFKEKIDKDLNVKVKSGATVKFKILNDVKFTNKGLKSSAIDVEPGATLDIYIKEGANVVADSNVSNEAQNADRSTGGEGAYAGIHLPSNANLILAGKGKFTSIGGQAGTGYGAVKGNAGGAGGGGAGAGIGGHGGKGGNGNIRIERDYFNNGLDACGVSGEKGEDCGNVTIKNDFKLYAYGGAGGKSYATTGVDSGDGAGGYPAAGIGGGRSRSWWWRSLERWWRILWWRRRKRKQRK